MIPYDVAEPGDQPAGAIRLGLVFDEPLPGSPVQVALTSSGARMLAASPDLQLAWKVLWLTSDMWPRVAADLREGRGGLPQAARPATAEGQQSNAVQYLN
ncbi:hypothetical protein L1785_20495 [Antribacter sp. KLBMP9083]|uniref:Uncharacterized protein n=1 Tax=Antribacter soli TaxID=2910976 RepID=A0AA41QIF9_9MICO|nr:hypothetical protein [Antribacter soli]MCF4123350.1 hypothetical protein [Antribacter soli]